MSDLKTQIKTQIETFFENYKKETQKEQKIEALKEIIHELNGSVLDIRDMSEVLRKAWDVEEGEIKVLIGMIYINDELARKLNEVRDYIGANDYYFVITSRKISEQKIYEYDLEVVNKSLERAKKVLGDNVILRYYNEDIIEIYKKLGEYKGLHIYIEFDIQIPRTEDP